MIYMHFGSRNARGILAYGYKIYYTILTYDRGGIRNGRKKRLL